MSNYLNHLVTRSLNPMDISVQPRLPSLFEPVAGVPALGTVPVDSGEPEGISELEAPEFREVASPRRSTHPEGVQSGTKRSPLPSHLEQHPSQPRRTLGAGELGFVPPVQQASSESLPVAPQSPIPQREDQQQSAPPVLKPAKVVDSIGEEPAIPQQTVVQRMVEQLFPSQPDNVDSRKVPANSAVRREDRPALIAHNVPTAAEPPATPAPRPVPYPPTVQPQITPLIQPIKTTAVVPVEPTQPAPTIQVTIGRIEVRATAPVNPPSTQVRLKPPVMSLDEYLHQRGGGR